MSFSLVIRSGSGDKGTRTLDPRLAKAVLSQLSYIPIGKVGLPGLEPGTSPLSEVRSNQLSYKPTKINILKGLLWLNDDLNF